MKEEFLHYIWQYKTYQQPIKTIDGKEIFVIDLGLKNENEGPDFLLSKLKIGNEIWAGSVEIHVKSSDWIKHKHKLNSAYENVILHVVYENDVVIKSNAGEQLDVLELKNFINYQDYYKYKSLIETKKFIFCSGQLQNISDFKIYSWLERLLIERLEQKTTQIEDLLLKTNNNWEQSFYLALANNFGFKINADAFQELAFCTPIEILARYKDNLFQIEAILFGQANFLNDKLDDEYAKSLSQEYKYLKKKHKLEAISINKWKFLRMRPVNFPTIRIAQFAKLIHQSSHLFSVVINAEKLSDLIDFFQLNTSSYWETHYVLGKPTKSIHKSFGKTAFNLILINTIVPFLFVYANHQKNEMLKERALMFLQNTTAENNSIITKFSEEGIKAHNAAQSQALIQLKTKYCNLTKCLNCAIGLQIIKN